MPARTVLRCSACDRIADDSGALACAACGELLAFVIESAAFDPAAIDATARARRASLEAHDRSGVWRFRELLPDVALDAITTMREGDVPLFDAPHGAAYAGVDRLAYLHLGANPTASFKDAGMTVAISHARERGARVAVCASTGNTAASMAAYAARAGITAVVIAPVDGISASKVAQTLDYGAHVVAVVGDFDDALRAVRALDPAVAAVVNSVNPYRIEGQKTAALVLLEQRAWRAPDWVILPGGNLGNTSALGKGFREAQTIGLTARTPHLGVVQAAGAAPFARAWRDGADLVPVRAQTDATAIRIGAPASWKKARAEVRASGGTVLDVEDAAIADARAVIGRDGVGCEPASAASLAGLRRLVAEGAVAADADIVCVLTGHVLKDTAYATRYHESGARYANTIVRGTEIATYLHALIGAPA
ncbi:threonine synthase [Vulcanimicrobium alpinum]|uniref:Threonine synthase n=1 Tax=Vulcanimicrobium alpinum TaxID=3016050 RepID=A0AAN1XW37_UNVUL|nr:threonine synthase [Vulcanimicrobium alpinum]BDE06454.1 threonine synthase [Vulcanimicrobium alpinum]